MESEIKKKKKLRRKARAGYRVQKQKNKEALVLALQENRNQQDIIESNRKEAQRVNQNEDISPSNNSIEYNLQSKENNQVSANFALSSPLEQQELPQNSEKRVDSLRLPKEHSFSLSPNQDCSPMQFENTEAKQLDRSNETASSLRDSINDELQVEENSQLFIDFVESPSLEQQKLSQDNEENFKLSQETSVSSLCQNRIKKVIKIEEEELSSSDNIKLLLLKQEKLFIQYKNRLEQLDLQDQMLTSFKKYIRLCNKHEEDVFKLKKEIIEYKLQIAQKKLK